MNRQKKYTQTKEKLIERNRELEMEVARFKYREEIIKNIFGITAPTIPVDNTRDYVEKEERKAPIARTSKPQPTTTFNCGRCRKVGEKVDKIYDDYYGDICVSCANHLYEEEKKRQAEQQKNIPTPTPKSASDTLDSGSTKEQFDKEVKDTMREGIKPSDVAKKKKKGYIPPSGYGLSNQTTTQSQEEEKTSMEQVEVREDSQGNVLCYCGAVATQIKKMADGKPEALCAEHKEKSDVEERMKPANLRKQVAEATAKKYKVRTGEIRPQIDCDNCGKKNLDGYWNNAKTNEKNFCHNCYQKVFPDIVNPKCDACGKKDETVGWFEDLAKNYCEVCAKRILDKAKK